MIFEFATATKIVFGKGLSNRLPEFTNKYGKNPLIILGGHKNGEKILKNSPYWEKMTVVQVKNEPELELIKDIVNLTQKEKNDMIISIGGGSVIDTGKAVSGLATNPGEITDYLEVVGNNLPLIQKPLPFFALPTTAGTGAEVTRNAGIIIPKKKVKVSLRSPFLYPTCAIVDPELTYSMPQTITANTGMDALIQVFEPFVSNKSNWMTDIFCREGMRKIGESLKEVYQNGDNEQARENMCWGSLLGGLSLANSGLGAVHGFAGVIGGAYHAPHGAVCAAILAGATEVNIKTIMQKCPQHPVLERYKEAGQLLFNRQMNHYSEIWDGIRDLCRFLNIQGLSTYGISEKDFKSVIEKAAIASSMQCNPIKLDAEELADILSLSM